MRLRWSRIIAANSACGRWAGRSTSEDARAARPSGSRDREFALPHVFDLVGDMLDVEFVEPPRAKQARLLLGPQDDVLIVSPGHGRLSLLERLWSRRPQTPRDSRRTPRRHERAAARRESVGWREVECKHRSRFGCGDVAVREFDRLGRAGRAAGRKEGDDLPGHAGIGRIVPPAEVRPQTVVAEGNGSVEGNGNQPRLSRAIRPAPRAAGRTGSWPELHLAAPRWLRD